MILEDLNIPQRKLYNYLNNNNWKKEEKGTISKGFRFIKAKIPASTYFHWNGSKIILVIEADGYRIPFNSEMPPGEFEIIIKNIKI